MPQLDLGKVVGDTGPQGPKGDQGIQGPAGQTGPGVAVGGSANQVLVKHSGTNYDTQWVDAGNLPSIAGVQDAIAIVANGDTHPAIASGQFVYVRNHSTLAEGLYKSTAAIGTDVALTTSNLTADSQGGLNKLKGDIDSLNSNLSPLITDKTWSGYTTPTLSNGSHYGTGCRYAKFGVFVHIIINVQFDSPPSNALLWKMPSGFVPIGGAQLAASGGGSYNAKAQAVVAENGDVHVTSVDKWVSASGIYFVAA